MDIFKKYFTPQQITGLGETGPDWGISVLNIGHNVHPATKNYPQADHPDAYYFNPYKGRTLAEFQLVYIAAGTGFFETAHTGPIPVNPGTVFFLYPGVWHRYQPDAEVGWEEYWVGFKGPFAQHLMDQQCFNKSMPLIHLGFNSEFLSIFIRLIETLKNEGVAFAQLAACLTIQLLGLVYAAALAKEKPADRKNEIVNNIRYKIHEHWPEVIDMEALAAAHFVSYVWFRKAFKEVTGLSPGQYHINLKIEKACQMLKETDLGIAEIAYKAGFGSEYHFSTLFKKKTGSAPGAFRLGARKEN